MAKNPSRVAATKKYRERCLANHLCTACGNPLPEDYKTVVCRGCRTTANARNTERRTEYKANGLCRECGEPSKPGGAFCDKCLQKDLALNRERRRAIRAKVFGHYGWYCACCGKSEPDFLTIDHINNDGAQHRKAVKDVYRDLIKRGFPPEFQTLCFNCNCAKGKLGRCPCQDRIVSQPFTFVCG